MFTVLSIVAVLIIVSLLAYNAVYRLVCEVRQIRNGSPHRFRYQIMTEDKRVEN